MQRHDGSAEGVDRDRKPRQPSLLVHAGDPRDEQPVVGRVGSIRRKPKEPPSTPLQGGGASKRPWVRVLSPVTDSAMSHDGRGGLTEGGEEQGGGGEKRARDLGGGADVAYGCGKVWGGREGFPRGKKKHRATLGGWQNQRYAMDFSFLGEGTGVPERKLMIARRSSDAACRSLSAPGGHRCWWRTAARSPSQALSRPTIRAGGGGSAL